MRALARLSWTWSFRAFTLLRTRVRVHWSLPLFVVFILLRAAWTGWSPLSIFLFGLVPTLVLFGSVLAHEYGHVLAGRAFGLRADTVILTPSAAWRWSARAARRRASSWWRRRCEGKKLREILPKLRGKDADLMMRWTDKAGIAEGLICARLPPAPADEGSSAAASRRHRAGSTRQRRPPGPPSCATCWSWYRIHREEQMRRTGGGDCVGRPLVGPGRIADV